MRYSTRLYLGLRCLVMCVSVFLVGCASFGEWRIRREVRALWQASHGDLQQKRAVLLSEDSLKSLDRIDIEIVVPRNELTRFTGLLTESFNAWRLDERPEIVLLASGTLT